MCQNVYNTNFFLSFSHFLLILTNFGLIFWRPYFFPPFFINWIGFDLCYIFHQRLNFYSFYIFLGQNAFNTNFLPIFTIFSHIWPLLTYFFRYPSFFFNFVFHWWQSVILQDIRFITTLVFFCVKMGRISNFYQFLQIFVHFWTLLAEFWGHVFIFLHFFSLNVFFWRFCAKIIKSMHILLVKIGVILNLGPFLTILALKPII